MANAGVDFAVSLLANSTAIPSANLLTWGLHYYKSHTVNGRIKKGELRFTQGVSQLAQVERFLTLKELREFLTTLKELRAGLELLKADSTTDRRQKKEKANLLAKACTKFYKSTITTSTTCVERQLNARADALSDAEQAERARTVLEFNTEKNDALELLESLTSDSNTGAANSSQGSQSTSIGHPVPDAVVISNSRFQADCSDQITPKDTLRFTTQISGDPLGVTATVPQNPFSPIMAPPPTYVSIGSSRKSSMPKAIMLKDLRRP